MKNYSRQREAILEVLRNSKSHPTADEVYQKVREKIPNISLGTVYRNLSLLSGSGEILMVSVGDDREHYDGDASPHIHLKCKKCGSLTDLFIENNRFFEAADKAGFRSSNMLCVIYGICKNCSDN